jgi:hypothetical protein
MTDENRSGRFGMLVVLVFAMSVEARDGAGAPPKSLAAPVEEGSFLLPAVGQDAEPTWGIKRGIAVGLWPNPGPRGLIRIYTPYLGQSRLTPLNFIAVEPMVGRVRGLSELEPSRIDEGVSGKAMWSANQRDRASRPAVPWRPARGLISTEEGHKVLSIFIGVEPFDHGARPVVEVRLREDRPHEVGFRVTATPGGKAMRSCILSATMGNYARLRRLYLKNRVEESRRVYEPFQSVFAGFAPHRQWGRDDLLERNEMAIAAATPDESDPARAHYSPDVAGHWHYQGVVATQYWRARTRPGLVVRVNGRQTYWASTAPIPGGVAYENFEFEAPFEPGQVFWFGVTPESPQKLGFAQF